MKCFPAIKILLLLALLAFLTGFGYARKTYVCYYESSSAQDTEVSILNMMDTVAYYTLRVYDYTGELIFSDSRSLTAFDSRYYRLSEKIGRASHYWGLFTVETDDDSFLLLTAEYFVDEMVCSIDNIIEPVPRYESGYKYWYGIYHANLGPGTTGLIIMNPQWFSVEFQVRVYDAEGRRLMSKSYTLAGRASAFYDLGDLVGTGSDIWGVVDISASSPIAIACEYYKRGGSRLEIDNVVDYYGKSRATSY